MSTHPLSRVNEINAESKTTAGIKKTSVTFTHDDYDVICEFIDTKQINMNFLRIEWKAERHGSKENISTELRAYIPYICLNFVTWLTKELSSREFRTFLFVEEDGYKVRYELSNGNLTLYSHGYN